MSAWITQQFSHSWNKRMGLASDWKLTNQLTNVIVQKTELSEMSILGISRLDRIWSAQAFSLHPVTWAGLVFKTFKNHAQLPCQCILLEQLKSKPHIALATCIQVTQLYEGMSWQVAAALRARDLRRWFVIRNQVHKQGWLYILWQVLLQHPSVEVYTP